MPLRHALLAACIAVAWGVNFVVIDIGLASFPPLLFAALRFVFTVLPAIFLVGLPRTGWRTVVGVGLFISMGQFGLLFVSIDRGLPAGLASLVLQVQAVFTILLAVVVLDERPAARQLAGAALAAVGIAIVGLGRGGDVPLLALLACVGAGASWGVGNVITRRARPSAPLALIVWSSLVPPIPLAAVSFVVEGPGAWAHAFGDLHASGLLALGYVIVVATFFGYGSWTWLMARHPAATVAPFTLLVPVVGIAAGWIALGEVPGTVEVIGAAVVLVGLAFVTGLVDLARRRSVDAAAARI